MLSFTINQHLHTRSNRVLSRRQDSQANKWSSGFAKKGSKPIYPIQLSSCTPFKLIRSFDVERANQPQLAKLKLTPGTPTVGSRPRV